MRPAGGRGNATRLTRATAAAATFLVALLLPLPSQAAQRETPAPSWYTNGTVRDLVRVDDTIYLGGTFTSVVDGNGNSAGRSNLAAIHATTGEILPWNPGADGDVLALEASPEGHVYVGGDFRSINGTNRKRLAAVDENGNVVSSFRADVGGRVLDLIHHNSSLIVAGELTSIAGRSRTLVGRVDALTGALDSSFAPSIDGGSVRGIELSDDRQHLYIGGNFASVEGRSNTAYAARVWIGSGSLDRNWRPGLDMPIFDIEATGDAVYLAVGGLGYENNRLQKHHATDGQELLRYLGSGDIQDLELRGDTLYVGGHFTKLFGGLPRAQVAAIDINDDHITDFAPTVLTLYGVWKILAGPEGLWLGGDFTEVGGLTRQGFAYLPTDAEPEIDGDLLLPRSTTWRYLDSGSAPAAGGGGGAASWAEAGYDDGGWASGVGEIGFGDGDERTVTRETDALYARATFTVSDPTDYDDVAIRVLADAGAAVYINGEQVMRHNLPGGPLTDETVATAGKWSTDEQTWVEHHIDVDHLQPGTNIVAVEVHGAYDNPTDMSFNAEIVGRRTGDNGGGGGDGGGGDGGPFTAIHRSDTWRYVDDGSVSGTAWRQTGFDDASWATGSAQFGFGDGDEATELESGHNVYWFRNSFDLAADATEAELWVLADDGVAVYVNGVEVVRENLADGPIDETTKAIDSRWGEPERTYSRHVIDPDLLVAGTNVVAVSVHNVWSGNGDLSFDLGLDTVLEVGGGGPGPGPIDYVTAETEWRFLDNGSQPDSGWISPGFADGAWSSGIGSFGFGDGDEATVVDSGHRGYFFRTTFTAEGAPDSLTLSLTFDDGAVVYLNGAEVARRNLPDGEITVDTKALGSRWGDDETTPVAITLDPALIIDGTNVLAVSVHNVWSGNSDLSFDARLSANQ